jgi:hypothetical protein
MKQFVWLILVILLAFAMSGCGKAVSSTTSTEASVIQDQAGLLSALEAAGAKTEIGDSISQDFFSVDGRLITINGTEGLQVFEYKSVEAMESDASKVAPNGGSVGTSMMNWLGTPHFFKSGRIMVLYLGDNKPTLSLLEKVMGKQFAGG